MAEYEHRRIVGGVTYTEAFLVSEAARLGVSVEQFVASMLQVSIIPNRTQTPWRGVAGERIEAGQEVSVDPASGLIVVHPSPWPQTDEQRVDNAAKLERAMKKVRP